MAARKILYIKLLFALVLLCFVYSSYSWEWGIMDDTEYVKKIHNSVAHYGLLGGIVQNVLNHKKVDMEFAGILRPMFWVHTSTIYLLPVGWAYTLRLLSYFFVFLGTLFCFQQALKEKHTVVSILGACLLLSMRSLYEGIGFISLQEFSGIVFVVLGMLCLTRERNLWAWLCFLLATGYKPPFFGVLLGHAVFVWLGPKQQRRFAILPLLSGLIIFLAAYLLAKQGQYSQQIYHLGMASILQTCLSFAKHAVAPFCVLLLFGIYAGKQIRLPSNFHNLNLYQRLGIFLMVAGIIYLGIMLPRGITRGLGYYHAPSVFLLFTGIFLLGIANLNTSRLAPPSKAVFYWIASLAVAGVVFGFSWQRILERNYSVNAIRAWAMNLPLDRRNIAVNSREVAQRLADILEIRSQGQWQGNIIPLLDGEPVPSQLNYYIYFSDQNAPNTTVMEKEIAEFGLVEIYEVGPTR